MKQYLLKQVQESQALSMQLLEDGKKEGVIRKDLKPAFYLYMLNHIMDMIEDPKLKTLMPDVRERNEELIKFWFYGMFDAIG